MEANEKFIPINQFSRPGVKRTFTRNLVFHYTGNPGATAENHFRYFGNQIANQNPNDNDPDTYASAHVFIDRTQSLIIIPLDEVAYHASQANPYSIGIELCIEEDGSFHPDTIKRAIEFSAEIAKKYNINPLGDFIRHYDVTGKICPKPWVDRPSDWEKFKQSVSDKIKGKGGTVEMQDWAFDFIESVMKDYWERMKGNVEVQNATHLAMEELRKATGRESNE